MLRQEVVADTLTNFSDSLIGSCIDPKVNYIKGVCKLYVYKTGACKGVNVDD